MTEHRLASMFAVGLLRAVEVAPRWADLVVGTGHERWQVLGERPNSPTWTQSVHAFGELTSTEAWQKTWQKKTAEECRIVQEIAGHREKKNPENAAENGAS